MRLHKALALLTVTLLWVSVAGAEPPNPPELPRVFLQTGLDQTPVTGQTIRVAAGEDLQAALDQAQPGDEVVLEVGATFTGNFVLPAKEETGQWITVRTSDLAGLPPEGVRVNPADAAAMPRLVDPTGNSALGTAPGAAFYRLIGLEITVAPTVENCWSLVSLGKGQEGQTSLDGLPHDLILDRLYIHGDPQHNCFRGVSLNSARSSVIDCHISDAHAVGFDTQAIGGFFGPGPYKIVNCRLEGAGENVMFGGADPRVPDLVPSDIEFRYNTCWKPLTWKIEDPTYAGTPWCVKNLFELKNARRILIEGNIFENNWVHAQAGTAILFTVRNQDGAAPWSAVQDVTFTNNRVRNSPSGFSILGYDDNHPSQQTLRVLIRNNLLERVDRTGFMVFGGAGDVEVDHNTFLPLNYLSFCMSGLSGHDAQGDVAGLPCRRFKLTNNIMGFGLYGQAIDGGQNTFEEAFPGLTWDKNLFVGYGEGRAQWAATSDKLPRGSIFEGKQTGDGQAGDADWPAVGFVDYTQGDYHLAPTSKYRALGTDGKDLGVDMDALNEALGGARTH